MKAIVAVVLSAACGWMLAGGAAEPSAQDQAEVRAVVELYFEGARTGAAGPFEKAWNIEHGRMVYVRRQESGATVVAVPVADAIKSWTSKPAEASWGKILSVDIVDGQMAVAKVELLFHGTIYVDFLSLYKIGTEWKIVNKTFVSRGKSDVGQKPAP